MLIGWYKVTGTPHTSPTPSSHLTHTLLTPHPHPPHLTHTLLIPHPHPPTPSSYLTHTLLMHLPHSPHTSLPHTRFAVATLGSIPFIFFVAMGDALAAIILSFLGSCDKEWTPPLVRFCLYLLTLLYGNSHLLF